jgi:ATP-binding cassette, subfamily B (MDR/TAP), member 1
VASVQDDDLTPEEKKELNRRVWALILEHKGWLFVGLLGAAIFGAVFPLWGYILAKAQNMFFFTDTDKMRRKAVKEAIYFCCLGLASLFSCTLQYWGVAQVGERISARLRSDLFESYLRRGITYFDQPENSAGELCSRLSNDSRLVHKAGGEALAKQLQAFFTLAVGCIIGFSASWRIAGVVIACFPANIVASAIQMQAVTGQQ